MTTVNNIKATAVADADNNLDNSLPVIYTPATLAAGKERVSRGLLAFGATDANNSVYRFARVNSAVALDAVEITAADVMSGLSAVDVGVYETEANGGGLAAGTAANQYLFKQGYNPSAGITTPVNLRFAALAAATAEQPLWQLLGLAADPQKPYDLALTATTRGTATGNISARVAYVGLDS